MAKINGVKVKLDLYQGTGKNGRKFGYVCGDEGGYFFTWMPTLEETVASCEIDEQDGDGGLEERGVVAFLREKLAKHFVVEEIDDDDNGD